MQAESVEADYVSWFVPRHGRVRARSGRRIRSSAGFPLATWGVPSGAGHWPGSARRLRRLVAPYLRHRDSEPKPGWETLPASGTCTALNSSTLYLSYMRTWPRESVSKFSQQKSSHGEVTDVLANLWRGSVCNAHVYKSPHLTSCT